MRNAEWKGGGRFRIPHSEFLICQPSKIACWFARRGGGKGGARLPIPHSEFRICQPSKIVGWSAVRGGVNPKCLYADPVAQRPRGVRARKPCCMRNGSYTSSRAGGRPPPAAAVG